MHMGFASATAFSQAVPHHEEKNKSVLKMKVNFSFNTNTHDFWEIYESIKKYYPIGLEQKEGRGIYYEYRGLKELEKILVDNVHDSNNFKERWVNFTDEIGKELNKEIFGTTYGQAPSFSSSVVLERKRIENCNILKAVNFSISFVGKFFQIYGLDTISVIEDREKLGYSNVVTASPHKEYKEIFDFVEKKIRTKYPNHKFVPFGFGQTRINGLQVRYMNNKNCTINVKIQNHSPYFVFSSIEFILLGKQAHCVPVYSTNAGTLQFNSGATAGTRAFSATKRKNNKL